MKTCDTPEGASPARDTAPPGAQTPSAHAATLPASSDTQQPAQDQAAQTPALQVPVPGSASSTEHATQQATQHYREEDPGSADSDAEEQQGSQTGEQQGESGGEEESSSDLDEEGQALLEQLLQRFGLRETSAPQEPEKPRERLLSSFDLEGIAQLIQEGKARRVVCMCGAGISVSAGIPDFRTPGTGLYSQLQRYNLPSPEAIFTLEYFRHNPEPFHRLAKELYPGTVKPTLTHYFLALLHRKGLLQRCFTLVKPDIVFFGENLPESFFQRSKTDMPQCDLLIVMGTSLVVYPFAGLLHKVSDSCPRLLINRELVGLTPRTEDPMSLLQASMQGRNKGFQFDEKLNYRDAKYLGDCDSGVRRLAELLGWLPELEQLQAEGHAAMDAAAAAKL